MIIAAVQAGVPNIILTLEAGGIGFAAAAIGQVVKQ
jgi:hypothetical protein